MKVSNLSAVLTKLSHCIDKLNFLKSDKPGRNVSNPIFLLGCLALVLLIVILVFYVFQGNSSVSTAGSQVTHTPSQAQVMMPIKNVPHHENNIKKVAPSARIPAQLLQAAPIKGNVQPTVRQMNTLKPLQSFSQYVVHTIEHDTTLPLTQRHAYLRYAKQLESYIKTVTLTSTTDHKIETLADELKLTTMQGQISSQRAKIAEANFNAVKAEANASKIQKTVLAPVHVTVPGEPHKVHKVIPTFHFLMTYLADGHWVGVISINKSRVTVVSV